MHIRGQTPLGGCGQFVHGELTMPAELYQQPDGVRNIYFIPPGGQRTIELDPHGGEVTRVVYQGFENGNGILLGLHVGEGLRGSGIGAALVGFATEHIGREGFQFVGTGRIHKPVIALLLKRLGFEPRSELCTAELLGSPKNGASIPLIRYLGAGLSANARKSGSRYGPFFKVAPRPSPYDVVPVNQARVVALHTTYRAPHPGAAAAEA